MLILSFNDDLNSTSGLASWIQVFLVIIAFIVVNVWYYRRERKFRWNLSTSYDTKNKGYDIEVINESGKNATGTVRLNKVLWTHVVNGTTIDSNILPGYYFKNLYHKVVSLSNENRYENLFISHQELHDSLADGMDSSAYKRLKRDINSSNDLNQGSYYIYFNFIDNLGHIHFTYIHIINKGY